MISLSEIKKVYSHLRVKHLIKKHESVFEGEVKYLYIPNNSDTLMIVFSGFTGKERKYNYISSFSKLKMNQLYILDIWGEEGSYYWLDYGNNKPEELTNKLINEIIINNSIKHVITAGSSKGGTAAIYFGLLHSAENIYSGSNQFYVGDYLNLTKHQHILEAMVGDRDKNEVIEYLNRKLTTAIANHTNNKGINLFYSTKESTYERDIIPLKECLNKNGVFYQETIVNFPNHSDIGIYFPAFVIKELNDF